MVFFCKRLLFEYTYGKMYYYEVGNLILLTILYY